MKSTTEKTKLRFLYVAKGRFATQQTRCRNMRLHFSLVNTIIIHDGTLKPKRVVQLVEHVLGQAHVRRAPRARF